MAKRVFRRKPSNMADVLVREAWLEELAAKEGLFVEQWNYPFVASFRQGEPKLMKYRFEHVWDDFKPGQVEVYRECGWEEVPGLFTQFAGVGLWGFRLFRADADAEEIHTEGQFVAASYRKRIYREWFVLIAALVSYLSPFMLWSGRWVQFLTQELVNILLLIVWFGVFTSIILAQMFSLMQVQREYRSGREIVRNQDWRRAKRRWDVRMCVSLALLVASFGLVKIQESQSWSKPHVEMEEVPYATLAELFDEDPATYPYDPTEGKIYDLLDKNAVRYEHLLLAPVRYQERQQGGALGCILDVDYLELANEELAKMYYTEWITYEDSKKVTWVERENLELAGMDEGIFYCDQHSNQQLYLRKGNVVVAYTFYGTHGGMVINIKDYAAEMAERFR